MARPSLESLLREACAPSLEHPDGNRAHVVTPSDDGQEFRFAELDSSGPLPPAAEARFAFFHFPFSLCSQKVRMTLMEMRVPYLSIDVNIQPGNYHPTYVKLRLRGRGDLPLARGWRGQSSVETEGFDPAVVPTLVDRAASIVVVDSRKICEYLAQQQAAAINPSSAQLLPLDPAAVEQLGREMTVVDETPHTALLYGKHPDVDRRPDPLPTVMVDMHEKKAAKVQAVLETTEVQTDPELKEAYESKVEKERSGTDFVGSPERMRAAYQDLFKIVAELDERLSAHGQGWVLGEAFSLADVVWSISLFRMKLMGVECAWAGGGEDQLNQVVRPHVLKYWEQVRDRPSFQWAAIKRPLLPPFAEKDW